MFRTNQVITTVSPGATSAPSGWLGVATTSASSTSGAQADSSLSTVTLPWGEST